jgi:hypothetical protein
LAGAKASHSEAERKAPTPPLNYDRVKAKVQSVKVNNILVAFYIFTMR